MFRLGKIFVEYLRTLSKSWTTPQLYLRGSLLARTKVIIYDFFHYKSTAKNCFFRKSRKFHFLEKK